MNKVKLTKIGNSTGIVLPKDVLQRMGAKAGDVLYVSETRAGYEISAYSPEVAEEITHAVEGMHKFRNAFRELAK